MDNKDRASMDGSTNNRKKETKEERYRKRFRMLEMNAKLQDLAAACFGRNANCLLFLKDKKGEFSEKRLKSFRSELVQVMEDARLTLRGAAFTPEEKELLESMITISVLIPAVNYGELPEEREDGTFGPVVKEYVSFETLLKMMKRAYPPMEEEEYIRQYEGEEKAGGFHIVDHVFFEMRIIADNLGQGFDLEPGTKRGKGKKKGKNVHTMLPEDTYTIANEDQDFEDWVEDLEIYEEMDKVMAAEASLNEPPQEVFDQMAKDMFRQMDAFEEGFPLKEEYLQACRTYRSLLFSSYPENLENVAEMAVNQFLMEHELSPISSQVDFWQVATELSVAERRIARWTYRERGGRK